MKVGFVACSSSKLTRAAPAWQLYTSPLFRLSVRYLTETVGVHRWYVLSAKHGLVAPETVLKPYDQTLTKMSTAERQAWGERVAEQVQAEWRRSGSEWRMQVLAGKSYCTPLREAMLKRGNAVAFALDFDQPLAGKSIGGRLQWLSQQLKGDTSQWHYEWGTLQGEHAIVDGIPVSVWQQTPINWAWAMKPLVAQLATGVADTRQQAKTKAVAAVRQLQGGEAPAVYEWVAPPSPIQWEADEEPSVDARDAARQILEVARRVGTDALEELGLDYLAEAVRMGELAGVSIGGEE